MAGYLIRRTLAGIATLLVASFLLFLLVAVSGNPLATLMANPHISPATIAIARQQLGLNQPLLLRYWTWLTQHADRQLRHQHHRPAGRAGALEPAGDHAADGDSRRDHRRVHRGDHRGGHRGQAVQHPRPHAHRVRVPVLLRAGVRDRDPAQRLPGDRRQQGRRPHHAVHDRREHPGRDRRVADLHQHPRPYRAARDHPGARHLRRVEPVPARLHAGRAQRRLRAVRPRQGAEPAPGALRARAAQRADPRRHRGGARLRHHHRRGDHYRDRLRLERDGPVPVSGADRAESVRTPQSCRRG